MELKNAKLFIDGTEIPVESVHHAVPGSDATVGIWGPVNCTITWFGKSCSELCALIESNFSPTTEKSWVVRGRVMNVTGYRGYVASYIIFRRKRENGGGWAVRVAYEASKSGRWLRSPLRPFRSLKSARMALKRRGVGL